MNSRKFQRQAAAAIKNELRSWQLIEAVKEQCRHPAHLISWSSTKTLCQCGEVLWQKGQENYSKEAKVTFSAEQLRDPAALVLDLKAKQEKAKLTLENIQAQCEHTEGKSFVGDGEEVCATCHKNWYETPEGKRYLEVIAVHT